MAATEVLAGAAALGTGYGLAKVEQVYRRLKFKNGKKNAQGNKQKGGKQR
ncbi:MAG: hypothetical protein ACRDQZ_06585 [Mycobacteriales bacterium]